MKETRKPLIAANWKMHKTLGESVAFVEAMIPKVRGLEDRELLVCSSFTSLYALSKILKNTGIYLGAQNMHFADSGAFTGEVSATMLLDVGCDFVILGHSERRHVFSETDEMIQKKVQKALQSGLKVVLCVGELLEERESGRAKEVVRTQLKSALESLETLDSLVIAYEPVWAIGTGHTATPKDAEEMHSFIRSLISELYDSDTAERLLIQYGGSVKPENISQLMGQPNIDGALVGGASLELDSFSRVLHFD